MNIKKGDTVQIISGDDKGKKGKVLEAMPKDNKILVENINVQTKHTKPRRAGETGGIVKQAAPISVSKAMVICPKCNKPTRVSYTIEGENKVRTCKKCSKTVDAK